MQQCVILIANEVVGCGIFCQFSNLDKCLPEAAAGDVISRIAVDYVGKDVPAGFDNYWLNSGRNIRLLGRPDPYYALFFAF